MSAPVHRVQVFPVDRALSIGRWGWDCICHIGGGVDFPDQASAEIAAELHCGRRYPIPVQA